jgi:uncharacterized protein YecT (DUF1311 family)
MANQDASPSNNTQPLLIIISFVGVLGGAVTVSLVKHGTLSQPAGYAPEPITTTTSTSAEPGPAATEQDTSSGHPSESPIALEPQPQRHIALAGPSFDCARAAYPSERLVCSSRELSSLDSEMATAYHAAVERLQLKQEKAALRASQNHWLRRTRESCDSVSCLMDIYVQRIRDLQAM